MGIAAMDILCCRITIGDADPSNPMRIQNGVEITEVQSLEINESYKKLIGTAIQSSLKMKLTEHGLL